MRRTLWFVTSNTINNLCLHKNRKEGDKGPIFFTQNRIGKNGKEFKMFKYRTMVIGADKILEELMEKDPAIREEYTKNKN